MLDITGHFKLVDIISMEYNDKTYFFGNVYYSENGVGDMLRVSCKQDDISYLQQYLDKDVTNIIKVAYNRYKKQFVPTFIIN